MNDLISRQAAIDHLKKRLYETAMNNNTEHPYYEEMADNRVDVWMNELPTIDAVPVVRCKDCEYYTADELWCRRLGLCGAFGPDDFCSHAERREG